MLKKGTDLNEFNLDNLKLCFYFALERYNIYVEKEILKKVKPWTTDKILQELRFCNLHREHDNVSRTIISFLRLSKHNIQQLVFNAINCRRLNHNYTIVSAANALNTKSYSPAKFVAAVEKGYDEQLHYEGKASYFDSAYVIAPLSGKYCINLISKLPEYYGKSTGNPIQIRISNASYQKQKFLFDEIASEIDFVITSARTNLKICLFGIANIDIIERHLNDIADATSSIDLFKRIVKIDGVGEFLAGQIAVDIGYVRKDLFDENELAPAGPGCKRGLNMVYKTTVSQSASLDRVQNLLKNIHRKQFTIWRYFGYDLPKFGTMSLMTIENLMCETSKYIREYNRRNNLNGNNEEFAISKKRRRVISRKKYASRRSTVIRKDKHGELTLSMSAQDKNSEDDYNLKQASIKSL